MADSEGSSAASAAAASSAPPVATRSSSVGQPSSSSPRQSSPRQRSQSGSARPTRQTPARKRAGGDDEKRAARAWANAYELSQDLHDKQLEMLERKYGGHLRAGRAARTIQRAYRQHCMNKNFAKLRIESVEKRLSRRFAEFSRSKTIWSDMVGNVEKEWGPANHHNHRYSAEETLMSAQQMFVRREDHMNENMSSYHQVSSSSKRTVRVMQKSHSLNTSLSTSSSSSAASAMLKDFRAGNKSLQRTAPLGLDLSTITEGALANAKSIPIQTQKTVPSSSNDESNNNRNSYPEMNDSSASDSPQDTPVEATVDLPSVNFENLLESKETDILNDSFHSDSSQEAASAPAPAPSVPVLSPSYSRPDHMDSMEDLVEASPRSAIGVAYEQFAFVDTDTEYEPVEIKVEETEDSDTLTRQSSTQCAAVDSDRTPTQDEQGTLTRIYCDTEVRLRPKKEQQQQQPPPNNSSNDSSSNNANTLQPRTGGAASEASPIWKRKSAAIGSNSSEDIKRMSNISEASEGENFDGRSLGGGSSLDGNSLQGMSSSPSSDTASLGSHEGNTYHRSVPVRQHTPQPYALQKLSDRERKRAYRIGLNLFNKKPEKGIRFLMERRFLDNRPMAVARFLIARKGLSKQMIGEYLGNIQKPFNMDVLHYFAEDIDLSGLQVDMALRKFQSHFRTPGEAQKIERLMEGFAQRYVDDNPDQVKKFQSTDTVFLLAFAIVMLNTDLHNQSIKPERKMKLPDFIKNLRGIDGGEDVDPDLLTGIYERIKTCEFKPGADHVSQVMKVEQMIVGKKPSSNVLALPHRRLVCYCRLYEVNDPNKREKLGLHQREVFLFNDLLLITKIFSKKKNQVQYSFRQSFPLCGMLVYLFETGHYKYGIRLTTNIDGKVLITFNARNDHDRTKFVEDLKEAIFEMNEMESLRIDEELAKQRLAQTPHNYNRHSKDSGVVDMELLKPSSDPGTNRLSAPECDGNLRKNTLSNSLCDLSEVQQRRGSGGSLDSGMASTSSACSTNHDDALGLPGGSHTLPLPSNHNHHHHHQQHSEHGGGGASGGKQQQPQLKSSGGSRFGLFGKKSRSSKSSLVGGGGQDASEV